MAVGVMLLEVMVALSPQHGDSSGIPENPIIFIFLIITLTTSITRLSARYHALPEYSYQDSAWT